MIHFRIVTHPADCGGYLPAVVQYEWLTSVSMLHKDCSEHNCTSGSPAHAVVLNIEPVNIFIIKNLDNMPLLTNATQKSIPYIFAFSKDFTIMVKYVFHTLLCQWHAWNDTDIPIFLAEVFVIRSFLSMDARNQINN